MRLKSTSVYYETCFLLSMVIDLNPFSAFNFKCQDQPVDDGEKTSNMLWRGVYHYTILLHVLSDIEVLLRLTIDDNVVYFECDCFVPNLLQ